MVVLRRRRKEPLLLTEQTRPSGQQLCSVVESLEPRHVYEYVVLVTTLPDEVRTVAQPSRDRADIEHAVDALNTQWGWGGYTTQDLTRCQTMARVVALIDTWWSVLVRLAIPARRAEAITSRPLLFTAVGKQTHHQGQTRLTLTSQHAHTRKVQRLFHGIRTFLGECQATAEPLGWAALWRTMLSRVFAACLNGRALTPPPLIPAPPSLSGVRGDTPGVNTYNPPFNCRF